MMHTEGVIKKMYDKIQHFAVGFCLSIAGVFFFPLIITGFIFGIGKELYDYVSGRGVPDWQDLIATFCGAVFASITVIIILN
jgi:putative lipoprotein